MVLIIAAAAVAIGFNSLFEMRQGQAMIPAPRRRKKFQFSV